MSIESFSSSKPSEHSFGKLEFALSPNAINDLFNNGELTVPDFNMHFAYNTYGLSFNAGDFFKVKFASGEEKTIRVMSKEDTKQYKIYKITFKIEEN